MKKLLLILLAAVTLGCDSRTESSDREKNTDTEVEHTADPAEADHAIHTDTTTSGGMNRPNPYDTL